MTAATGATLRFTQVDVFSEVGFMGNPVAVVHDADELTDEQMGLIARWTNLSETTFLTTPDDPDADYAVRIWTPGGELPFAGHPTLGTAHAWLGAGGSPHDGEVIVQQCGAGLVDVRRGDRLSFAGPELVRSGELTDDEMSAAADAVGVRVEDVLRGAWVDNGPGWMALQLADADAVLACELDPVAAGDLKLGVVGLCPAGRECAVEVRAFVPSLGIGEDPVTGSLNAGIAEWLVGDVLPESYVAAQGAAVGRQGRVHIDRIDDTIWVGGDTRTVVSGTIAVH